FIPFFHAILSRVGHRETRDLQGWRNWFARWVILLCVFAFPIALSPSLFVFFTEGRYGLIAFDLGLWLLLIFRFFFVPQRSYHINSILWLAILYTMTVMFYVELGPHYARSGWLVMCAVMGALLYGVRGTVVATAINTGILILLYWLMPLQHPAWAAVFNAPLIQWTMFVVNISLITLVTGLPVGFMLDQLDRSLKQKRESEEKYRFFAENATDVIWTFSLESMRFTYVSPSILQMRGYTPQEAMELTLEQTLSPESLEQVMKTLQEELSKENEEGVDQKRARTLELQQLRKDGSYGLAEATVSFIRNADGQPVEVLGVTRDITERKRSEEEKRSLEERLQRAEKMEALGTRAGGVAHDLNNVLGIIVGYSELLLYEVDAPSPLRPRLVNILGGSQRAAAIVQDLLTLARRGISGRQVLNLNKTVVDCQNSPEFENLSFHHSSIKIKTDLEPDLLNISGSLVHLGKTLFNLVSNASEAMPKGGTLTIRTSNQYLDAPIQGYDEVREGDYVVLSVSDTGEGIPAADLNRIFEPFYTKKVMGRSGTGLGLAVVWGTVKDHHGYINVQSEEDRGSTFTLYFPVTREEISIEPVGVSISEYMGNGETILVVDDVTGQRDLAEEMLEKLNYNVTSVSSGEEAVAHLKEHKVDLMVLDMIMDPGMDGLDTYKKILEIHPRQKAIIVSGFSESDRVRSAQALGAGAYVKKPYVLEKLGLAVKKELAQATITGSGHEKN
ncbi:MAG: ATP-binding protein, partial [Thermodesulfobacteriota bacterium]